MNRFSVARIMFICVAVGLVQMPAMTSASFPASDQWSSSSIDLWVPADGIGLYSLDAGRWLRPDGLGVFDVAVGHQHGIELCFYFADNRGAARVMNEGDQILGTAKATDDPVSGKDCFSLSTELLEELPVLDLVSGPRSNITRTTNYAPPTSISGGPSEPGEGQSSTLTQLRVREVFDMTVYAPVGSENLYWNGEVMGAVDVPIDDANALHLCVEEGDGVVAVSINDGPIEQVPSACIMVDVTCGVPLTLGLYVSGADPSTYSAPPLGPNPTPFTRTTKIRPIKTCR